MVLVDPTTLAFAFDNDYGFEGNESDVYALNGDRSRNMVAIVRLLEPVVPSLRVAADYNPGVGFNNCEIPAVDTTLRLGLVACESDVSVQVFRPTFVRRDPIGTGSITCCAAHSSRGYYLAVVRKGGPAGEDVLQARRTSDGLLIREMIIGTSVGPDAVVISPNGRFAVVCNEAEDPWYPGSITTYDLGAGPYPDPITAALAIAPPNHVALSGLVPSVGSFSTRVYDRIYNSIPAGATFTTGGVSVVLPVGSRAQHGGGGSIADLTPITVSANGLVMTPLYRFDNPDHTLIFTLDDTAKHLEPELAAFDATSTTCVVTLQENNAVVVLDFTLPVPSVRATNGVMGLGKVDVVNADVVNSATGDPAIFKDLLQREREPDGVAVATLGGLPCFLTVDEGDTFGNTANQPSNSRTRGGRTLSIFRLSDGAFLGDTGNGLDAAANGVGRWGAFVEQAGRARRGGSEPENLDVVQVNGRTLAIVGLERANGVALVDVTDPKAPSVLDVAGIGGLTLTAARQAPEGIEIFTHSGRTFALVGYETSGTVGIYEIR
jgi:hypothetical protein